MFADPFPRSRRLHWSAAEICLHSAPELIGAGARERGKQMNAEFDVIVVGSSMGGMNTAAALPRFEHRVPLLEQAPFVGGLTHSFTRSGFPYAVGLHYYGIFGPNQSAGRLLDWLSGGA